MTEALSYIKKAKNGCYVLCSEPEASGIVFSGTPYQLAGRPEMGDVETVTVEEADAGTELQLVNHTVTAAARLSGQMEAAARRYRQIAWIPQELALPFEWVKEMVALPFGLKVNRSVPFSEERLFTCFDELGLEHELYTKRVNEVSGGQRQRIMLAVAAMLNKPLIIIDEPTSALDAGSTGKVLSFFRRQAERGTAVLAVSHDKDFASGCHYLIEL